MLPACTPAITASTREALITAATATSASVATIHPANKVKTPRATARTATGTRARSSSCTPTWRTAATPETASASRPGYVAACHTDALTPGVREAPAMTTATVAYGTANAAAVRPQSVRVRAPQERAATMPPRYISAITPMVRPSGTSVTEPPSGPCSSNAT